MPPGHELRDAGFDRRGLIEQADRARRPDGDADDLFNGGVLPAASPADLPGRFRGAGRRDDHGGGGRTPDPAAVRDFLEAAHNYCIWQAGDIMAEDGIRPPG
jgi:hypothetical protein